MNGKRWSLLGAASWLVVGVGHLALQIVLLRGPSEATRAKDRFLADQPFPTILGLERTSLEVSYGTSIVMGWSLLVAGLLLLLAERNGTRKSLGSVRAVGLVASLGGAVVALLALPAPPVILFSAASIFYGLSILPSRAPRAERAPA